MQLNTLFSSYSLNLNTKKVISFTKQTEQDNQISFLLILTTKETEFFL